MGAWIIDDDTADAFHLKIPSGTIFAAMSNDVSMVE